MPTMHVHTLGRTSSGWSLILFSVPLRILSIAAIIAVRFGGGGTSAYLSLINFVFSSFKGEAHLVNGVPLDVHVQVGFIT